MFYFCFPARSAVVGELVQCVPARNGLHQLQYQGFTYVFKARLQCGSDQWCCTSRQKTGCMSVINMQRTGVKVVRDFHNHKKPEVTINLPVESSETNIPEWVSIYYAKASDTIYTCNVCNDSLMITEKSTELLEHIQEKHKDIEELHKQQTPNVNYHIEYLEFNVGENEENKILGMVCQVPAVKQETKKPIIIKKKKPATVKFLPTDHMDLTEESDGQLTRKRSWVWKYFNRLSSVIFRCNLCTAVLSIKGCNTNNMNRHVRSRHSSIYAREMQNKNVEIELSTSSPVLNTLGLDWALEKPVSVKTEEIAPNKADSEDNVYRGRRSWIWMYFIRTNATSAQCRLCKRHISHGGNATGNMNRHLKMIHNMTATDYSWIWKVFDTEDPENFTCKICQHPITKLPDKEKSIQDILNHLRVEHSVVSGDQIIESHEEEEVLLK